MGNQTRLDQRVIACWKVMSLISLFYCVDCDLKHGGRKQKQRWYGGI